MRVGMEWIDLAQDRDRWRALKKAVMNLRVSFHSHNARSSCHGCCPFPCLAAFPILPFTTVFQVRLHVYKYCSTSLSLLTSYVPDAVLFTPTRCFKSSQISGTGLITGRTAYKHCLAAAMTSWYRLCYCFSKLSRCHKNEPTNTSSQNGMFPPHFLIWIRSWEFRPVRCDKRHHQSRARNSVLNYKVASNLTSQLWPSARSMKTLPLLTAVEADPISNHHSSSCARSGCSACRCVPFRTRWSGLLPLPERSELWYLLLYKVVQIWPGLICV